MIEYETNAEATAAIAALHQEPSPQLNNHVLQCKYIRRLPSRPTVCADWSLLLAPVFA